MGRKLSTGMVFRNIFYILAIIWGIATPVLLIAGIFTDSIPFFSNIKYWIVLMFSKGVDIETIPSYIPMTAGILFSPLYILPVIGVFSGIRCWKDRKYDSVVCSNAAMVVGIIALNPLLILAGFLNHRVYIKNNKYMPDNKRRAK